MLITVLIRNRKNYKIVDCVVTGGGKLIDEKNATKMDGPGGPAFVKQYSKTGAQSF
jgi:hypothetical protein